MNYRDDIDGLRTIAVFLVILNHAGFMLFSGGFVGVDVFFVISGFLITSIIYPKIVENKFSLSGFFTKRIKRLMPVLFFIMAVTAIVFTCVMLPQDLMMFYRSMIWVLLYGANFFFWRENGGYFEGNSQEVPLLHTWSLAVEEQYYFVWPIMLIIGIRFLGAKITALLSVALFIAMTVFSQWGTEITVGAAYYLLPTRFFELLLGSCLAIFWFKMPKLSTSKMHGLSILGLLLILGSSFLLNEHSMFPGYNALYPIVGTALLIYSQNGIVNKFLKLKPMLFTGMISYSLYLWHWPILALMRYLSIELTLPVQLGCIALTYVLSVFSYYYIEKPCRDIKLTTFKSIALKMYILPTLLLVGFASIGIYQQGYQSRFDEPVIAMEKALNTFSNVSRKDCHSAFRDNDRQPLDRCIIGSINESNEKKGVFIFGDSHANHMVPFIEKFINDAQLWGQDYTLDRCVPVAGLNWGKDLYKAQRCKSRNDNAIKHIQENDFKYVVMSASWPGIETTRMFNETSQVTDSKDKQALFQRKMLETVKLIIAQGAIPVLAEDTPDLGGKSPKCPIKKSLFDSTLDCSINLVENPLVSEAFLQLKATYPQIVIIKPSDMFCEGTVCDMQLDQVPLYRDNDHLNEVGAKKLAEQYLSTHGNFLK